MEGEDEGREEREGKEKVRKGEGGGVRMGGGERRWGKKKGGGEGGRKHRNNTYGMHISTCMYILIIAYSITLLIVTLHIPWTHTFSFF